MQDSLRGLRQTWSPGPAGWPGGRETPKPRESTIVGPRQTATDPAVMSPFATAAARIAQALSRPAADMPTDSGLPVGPIGGIRAVQLVLDHACTRLSDDIRAKFVFFGLVNFMSPYKI